MHRCLGISQSLVDAAEYERITFEYAMSAARAMAPLHDDFRFCFLSGEGADSSEQSRVRFARVKGRTENALLALGKPCVYNFRPAFIHPSAPRANPQLVERAADGLAPLFYRFWPSKIIPAEALGRAMIQVAKHGHNGRMIDNVEARCLGGA